MNFYNYFLPTTKENSTCLAKSMNDLGEPLATKKCANVFDTLRKNGYSEKTIEQENAMMYNLKNLPSNNFEA